jgi:uncharacterized delta-60 repeat protein
MGLFSLARAAFATTLPIDGFDPNANNIVSSIVIQSDGKILVGGYFTQLTPNGINPSGSGHIARLNHDGTVDTSFAPSTDQPVGTMVLQPDGNILIAGQFTQIKATGGGSAVSRPYAARLSPTGALDTVFNPSPNGVVYAIAYQPNGQIIIGGAFTTVQPGGVGTPIVRNHVARFNSDGSLDQGFNPNTDKTVLALAVEPNGQVLIGGGFSTLSPNGATTATNRSCAARVNSDGTLDTTFDPEPNGSVMSFQIQANGQIIMGGEFLTVTPNGAAGPTQANFLARLNPDGSLDSSYIINPLASVTSTALQPDGKLIVVGNFTQIYPINAITYASIPYIARINQDGSLDETFIPTPNQAVNAVAVQPDGNVVLGGYFTALSPLDSVVSVTRNFIARVGPYGEPDATLATDNEGMVFATAATSGGQTYIGGTFLSVGGASQTYLARLNADGSLDPSYAPVLDGAVQSMTLDSTGKLLIGGSFTQINGTLHPHLARLNPDGSLDYAFNPSPNGSVVAIALQGSQIIVSGSFTGFEPNGSTVEYGVNYLARLNSDGSLDLTFNPNPNGSVFALAMQPDGRILVGGGFTAIGGVTRGYIARLLPTGLIDTATFDPETNSAVLAIAIQPDGRIVIGGGFTEIVPQTSKATSTTSTANTSTITQYGNKIIVPNAGYSASTPIPINYMARLQTDGELDTTFWPDASATVVAINLLPNGQFLVGGIFTSFAPGGNPTGTIRNRIARINADGTLDTGFDPNANEYIQSISVLANGNYMITGLFTALQPNGAASPTNENHIAVLNTDGTVSPTFTAGAASTVTGAVTAFASEPNGQIIVGGSYSAMGGNPDSFISRYNPDGTPDVVYTPATDGPVNAISVLPSGSLTPVPSDAGVWLESNGTVRHTLTDTSNGEIVCVAQQSDGRLILGGLFYATVGSTTLQNLIRLNTDGSIDTTFNPVPNGVVNAILIQPNGQILIGGAFNGIGGNTVSYLGRLNADGSVDKTFLPQPSAEVLCLSFTSSGEILAGGDFTYVTPTATTLGGENSAGTTVTAQAASYTALFTTGGTLDTTYNPDPNGPVYAQAVLPNGQFLLAGAFTALSPGAVAPTYTIQDLARVNANGTVDTTFYPDPNAQIETLAVLPNGQYLVGGDFQSFQQNPNITGIAEGTAGYINLGPLTSINYLARLNTNGTVDTSFNPDPNAAITYLTLQSDGKILVGGGFTTLQPNATGIVIYRDNIVRLNSNGTLDPTFEPILNGAVDTVVELADNSVYVGGYFTTVQVGGAVMLGGSFQNVAGNGATPYLTRLNSDGTLDTTFTTTVDGAVNAIVSVANGQSYVGGAFNNVNGQPQAHVVNLNAIGAVVPTFNPSPNGNVNAIAVQPNGWVLLAGAFSTVGGQQANYLARVSPGGVLDTTYAPAVNGTINAAVLQPNGQLLIGGNFTSVAGTPVGYIARINADGSLDPTFNPGANAQVQAITLQVDGSIYVGGSFTTIGGYAIPYLARVLQNGSVDTTFVPSPNAPAGALLVQNDGKLLIGGSFTTVGGLLRPKMARLPAPSPVTESFSVTGNQESLTWTIGGPAPVFSGVKMEESADGTNWSTVGYASSSDGVNWQLNGAPPTGVSSFLVRATGITLGSQYGSSGLNQYVYYVDTSGLPVVESAEFTSGATGTPFLFAVIPSVSGSTFTATGLPPGLSINLTTGIVSGTPTALGTYNAVVTVTDPAGSTQSALTITIGAPTASESTFVPAATSASNRLINISSRAVLTGIQNLFSGFVVTGTGTKTVLVRAVGPGLAPFGLSNFMPTPEVDVYSASGTLLSRNNTGWNSSLQPVFAQVGAFGLTQGSNDVAFLINAAPGAYTLHVYDPNGVGGVVLAEIYDTTSAPLTAANRLVNISSRGTVSPGAGALIGGFVVTGNSTKSVLIRGVGPGLSPFGVTDCLPDPVLNVFDANGNLVAQNQDWTNQSVSGAYQPAISAADIVATDANTGAFALSAQNPDTAVIVNLPPGAYTFEVTSASNSTGEALAEVYEIP